MRNIRAVDAMENGHMSEKFRFMANAPLTTREVHNKDTIDRVLRSFLLAKRTLGLSAEEALMFLAIGCASLNHCEAHSVLKPVTFGCISRLTGIPKETVRRKAARLGAKELICIDVDGVTLRDTKGWTAIGAALD